MGQGVSVQDLISIIVPVYNTEKYLDQCIQSVLAQTYTNWELLLVDDGSTDSSGAICDKYAAQDSRIKVLHKENTGVSDSKNIALDMAKGEYIMFLDSDDYWYINDCIAQLYAKSQELGVDIVRGEYKAVDEEGNLLFKRTLNATKQQAVNKLLTPYQFLTEVIQGEFFLVLSLFKRHTLDTIRFSNRAFLEDIEFHIRCLASPKVYCSYIPLRFYAYRKHATAVSHKRTIQKLKDSFSLCYFYHEYESIVSDINYKQFLRNESIMLYAYTMATVASSPHFKDRHKIIKELNLAKTRKDVYNWISSGSKRYYSPVFYTHPSMGVWYMFGRNIILDTAYRIRKFLKLT